MRASLTHPGSASARRVALAIAGAAAIATAALTGGELGGAALRAAALLGALGLAAAWLRQGRRLRRGVGTDPLVGVEARQPLSREAGLVLVRIEARRLLVGYGRAGVSLVAEIDPQGSQRWCGSAAFDGLDPQEAPAGCGFAAPDRPGEKDRSP